MTRGHSGWMALPDAPHPRDLTDEQWNFIGPFLPELARRKDGRGRPWRENRAVFNGILWILRTGAPWADLPDRYPSYQTCHRRFQQWVRSGVLRSILEVLAQALLDEGYLDWCTPRSLSGLSGSYRSFSSGTMPTSRTDWMRNLHTVA
jgi:transposase